MTKVGDIYYTSWGYDQTNYEYVVVVEVSPSGKTALCQRARCDQVGQTHQCNIQRPTNQPFGDVFRLRVDGYPRTGEPTLRGSYPFCHDGMVKTGKRLGTFWKWDGQRAFHETDLMFGH